MVIVVGVLAVALSTGVAMADAQQSKQSPAALAGPLADHADPAPAFAVAPQPDGSAAVHVTYAFDLTDDARAEAFEELQTNDTAVTAFEERFAQRLSTVADDAAEATGRDMAVTDVALSLREVGATGIVELSLTWEGLTALDGERLVVTEPFASGYEPDRPVHVLVPDGYDVASASPSPDDRDGGQLGWDRGRNLREFEVVLEPAADTASGGDTQTDGGSGPGFGVVAALVALAAVLGLAHRLR